MRIFKHKLEVTDGQRIYLPEGAQILTIQTQNGQPCLWVLCDPARELFPRYIRIYGTGNPLPEEIGKYISTFQQDNGLLVWHAFEIEGDEEPDE